MTKGNILEIGKKLTIANTVGARESRRCPAYVNTYSRYKRVIHF